MPPVVSTDHRPDGVAVVSFSNPPVNALSMGLRVLLGNAIKSAISSSGTRAIVLHATGSPGFFSSGADVSEFALASKGGNPFTAEAAWLYSGVEDAKVPVVAAIDGICFGGALELVLCCAGRVATPKSSFALPELRLGIIPGLGGTQRLPRVVGFKTGLEMMLMSTTVPAKAAKQIELIDVMSSNVVEDAAKYALKIAAGSIPRHISIDRNDKIGDLKTCQAVVDALMRDKIPRLSKKGRLIQFKACVDVSLYGVKHGGREGIKEEWRAFGRLVVSPQSLGLVHTFFATRQTSKVALPGDPNVKQPGTSPSSVGIIGGGLMGAGIATATLMAGIPVVIKELNEKFAQAAKKRVAKNLGTKHAAKISLLTATAKYEELANVGLVIEAALENPKVKQQIFAALEAHCRPDCILATNTSTINLDVIAMGCPNAKSQGRVIGAHFFSPAHKMPLLEIVRTEATSTKVIKDLIAYGKKIKKTPVVVGNCAGFAVNRMYFPQGMVSCFLAVDVGIDPYLIDRAMESFGIAMGPQRLLDLVGVDIATAVGGVFQMAYADRAVSTSPLITNMAAAGRLGIKSGKGFYRSEGKARMGSPAGVPDTEGVKPILEKTRASLDQERIIRIRKKMGILSDNDIVDMILLACVNEGCRLLYEGVAHSSADLDVCSVMGMAFPAYRGGLLFWANETFGGALGVKNRLEYFYALSEKFPLFKPSFALCRAAQSQKAIGRVPAPQLLPGSPEDIVVVSAYRTAVGRAGRGGLKDTLPDDLITPVLKTILKETGVDMKGVGDVVAGTVLQRGDTGVVELRVAGLLAGLPETVPVKTVNRLCSSGLQAIADGAAAIQAGHQDIVIAGGFESMSMASMNNTELRPNPLVRRRKEAASCYFTMGQTSENVVEKFGISRERQDRLAVCSHARASLAKYSGRQSSEIVPIKTRVKVIDKQTKKPIGIKDVVVQADEGVRLGVTMGALAKLPPVFRKGGSTTPGNSSQLSDGAAFVMLMKRSEAESRKLTPLASLRSFAVAGVDPAVMGIGPVFAIPEALKRAGLSIEDIDLFELNEAFGSQADYCIETLGLNRDIVNVNGGAIAIGHPLGMTGARLSVSIIHELRRRNARFGVVSMCIGAGMGAAAVYEINSPSHSSKL